MPVIKQKTVGDDTLQLKRARTTKPGKQYEYVVEKQGGDFRTERVYTREEAMQEFRESVDVFENKNSSRTNSGRGGGPPGMGGFMGGGGFFGGGRDEGTDDEDEQRGPVGVGMGFFDADGDGEDDEPPEFRFL